MDSATDSEAPLQEKTRRNPKRPAVIPQLKRAGYTIDRVIMRPDGSTEFVVAGGKAEEPNPWHK